MPGLTSALKFAFKWHWNLLALGAGVVAGLLSGRPGEILPLVGALELAYLGFLGTNERFQRVVGAIERGPPAAPQAPSNEQIERILCFLSDKDHERYQALRERVLALNQLTQELNSTRGRTDDSFSSLRMESLDKLLWVFLRLLHQKNTLDSFLDGTDRNALANEIKQTEATLKAATEGDRGPRIIQSLTDKLATMKERLANHKQAEENRELLRVEIDKTEQKTVQICEMGLASGDPGGVLSQQVDGIAGSVAASEQALAGLNLSDLFDAERAPNLLQTGPAARMEKE